LPRNHAGGGSGRRCPPSTGRLGRCHQQWGLQLRVKFIRYFDDAQIVGSGVADISTRRTGGLRRKPASHD
jgi:hypothetical protein